MHKMRSFVVLLSSFLLMLGLGVALGANTSASKKSPANTVSKSSAKSSPATDKSTAGHMKKSSRKSMSHVLASVEELSGTIAFIGRSDKEVTLLGTNGVPYDFQLTRKTRVDLAGQKIGATELLGENHKQATVRFLPTTRGNLAESFDINAS